jgi:acyl-CoA thioester hydrolase
VTRGAGPHPWHLSDRYPPFRFTVRQRVGFDETDAQGIVYYGRYMPYFDRARVEYLRELGVLGAPRDREQFVMRRNEVDYLAPAAFDDLIEVLVRVALIGTTSTTFEYAAHRADGTLLATARQVMVRIDLRERIPVVVPEGFRAAVAAFEGGPDEGPV